MPKLLPYFRWYPADAETDHLYASMDDAELGFFHRCLNRAWLNEGLPVDMDELAAIMRVPRKVLDQRWVKVGRCFHLSEVTGKLVNKRQEEERNHAQTKSERNSNAVRTRYVRRTNESQRAYVSESVSENQKIKPFQKRKETAPSYEDVLAAWKWYQDEYPTEVNTFVETQLFISLMESDQDLADLRRNLPLYKQTRQWQDGYPPSSENFLSKRVFKITPKARDSPEPLTPSQRALANIRERMARGENVDAG